MIAENLPSPLAAPDADVLLRAPDFDAALALFLDRLGFRLDVITGADDPRRAVVSGHDVRVTIEREAPPAHHGASGTELTGLLVTHARHGDWHAGRAGMRYRDLIPGRLGGLLIGSHIQIPDGGPVPDYVHYHEIDVQLIVCAHGWVEVVYEDQGPPFVMQAGDAVLQPPHIRHRVLRASPGLEVYEFASPAVHDTFVDHHLTLPTAQVRPDREFAGQRFVHHVAAQAAWSESDPAGWQWCDTGLHRASRGAVDVQIGRMTTVNGQQAAPLTRCDPSLHAVVLVTGAMSLIAPHRAPQLLSPGSCAVVPADLPVTWEGAQPDTTTLLVRLTEGTAT
jgi:quercetin dioxygenase-like cupin family protein